MVNLRVCSAIFGIRLPNGFFFYRWRSGLIQDHLFTGKPPIQHLGLQHGRTSTCKGLFCRLYDEHADAENGIEDPLID